MIKHIRLDELNITVDKDTIVCYINQRGELYHNNNKYDPIQIIDLPANHYLKSTQHT